MFSDNEVRLPPPACETGDILVAAPPELTSSAQPNQLLRFLPIVTAVATVMAMAAVYATRSSVARNPIFLIFPVMMLVSALATALSNSDRRRGELNARRADYFGYLTEMRASVTRAAAAQRASSIWSHPDPAALWTLVGSGRMWERAAEDADFCQVRIGVGPVPLARRLIAPAAEPVHRLDPVSAAALDRFMRVQSSVSDMPISIPVHGSVCIRGDAARARELLRAVVCQLAVLHSPAAVAIVAVVSDRARADWDWLKWLPHNRHTHVSDDLGPARMVYPSMALARDALDLTDRRVVLIVDSDGQPSDNDATMLMLEERSGEELVVTVAGKDVVAQPDRLSYHAALVCAQRLAGYRPSRSEGSPSGARWQDLIGIPDIDSYSSSTRRHGSDLRVPVGTTVDGAVVELDIKEAAANGMGPHGLCIGATGSGKSEFLRTVALGMIVGHSPDELNLVLVDFKGGATFAGLEPAPHVAAVITNLSDKAALVARMRDALMGEMTRRQEALREAGNLDGIAAYQRRRRIDPGLPPLPTLFVIVDEFSELLSQHPDFADVFVAIGRLGRSLGVHLLLASQRLDEGRLRGLDSHLSYRVCLKTLSVNESRMVLGSAEAYELPGTPGAAYLRVGADTPIRFHTAFVSGPAAVGLPVVVQPQEPSVREFGTAPVGSVDISRATTGPAECPTVLQAIVERVSGHGPRAHEIWLPPLAASPALDAVLREAAPIRPLLVPIGIVDRPFDQRRTPLVVDVSGAAGNVAVVGAPQSGKSTGLRTLMTALAMTHDPRMVQFYCLDFGGGSLASMRDWPHVGSVAGRADPERVLRTIARLGAVIRCREALFREHGIESMAHYRRLKFAGDSLCDSFGDVFLVVDGWLSLQRELEMAEQSITALAAEGLSYGVHVVVAASRWPEIRPALRDQIGTRIELRLGDPADSELDRRRAQQVPEGCPGRGLSGDGLHMVIALPVLDGQAVKGYGSGWSAPPIPLLPRRIEQSDIVAQACGSELVVGVEEAELGPVAIDFTQQLHLLVLGDNECGKTATLRTLCHELVRTTSAAQAQLFIVDPRRSLLDVVDAESSCWGGYSASVDAVAESMRRVVETLRGRMPPPDVTATQLRNRSWWSGPEIYVIVDDYDIIGGDPFAPLLTMLPHSRDVGLHLVVARRIGGAARAMYEPLFTGLRDVGCMTLLMSGSPDDGLTIGSLRPSPLPPGRGMLIPRRGDPQRIHVGWTPPS